MKAKCKKLLAPAIVGAALLQLTACGGGGGTGGGTGASGQQPRQFESEAEGTYVAEMQIMNRGVGGAISSSLSITKEGEKMTAYLRFNGGMPSTAHQQRVHVGTACPTDADDTNGDGYVDINEAFAKAGKILFPLDADISGQERGSSLWPMGDIYGSYNWERATNFERFIKDLREPDLNEENDYAKLGPDGALNLDGRVVLIHGTTKEISNLPDTVGSRNRLANFQTIPIACGVIRKVSGVPGVVEEDPSFGAAGEGETVGGSSGADDGTTIPVDGAYRPGETTGGTTGRTNEDNTNTDHGSTSGGTAGSTSGDTTGGWRWPWERPRTTTGGTGGGTTGDTTGGSTTGSSTSGDTSGGTAGGSTSGGSYGDDDGNDDN